jgi:hypothetical protein
VGFEYWTILKPAFFMENFVRPSFMFANWVDDRLVSVIAPDTVLPVIAVRDIGAAGAAAVDDPTKFTKLDIELAGDYLTMTEIATVLSDVLDAELEATSLSPAEAVEQGMPEFGRMHVWHNEVGSPARPERMRALGLTPPISRPGQKRTCGAASPTLTTRVSHEGKCSTCPGWLLCQRFVACSTGAPLPQR